MAWGDIEVKVSKRDQTITIRSGEALAVVHFEDIVTVDPKFPGCLSIEVVTLQGRVEVGSK